ncbi:DNA recombination protein RmuC [Escherichia coli]
MRNHIRLLGRKDYQQLPGLRTLDYVLMFIPFNPVFYWRLTASQADHPSA